jgi:hypothetical protein
MKITAVQNINLKTLGQLALCLLSLGFAFSEQASAATVAYVGSETGLPGNDYSVQNWSNPGVAKAWNVSASEVYGSSGYIQIRPTSTVTPVRLEVSAGAGNDFGVNESTNPSLLSKPNFIGALTGSAGSFVNLGGYQTYRGPDGTSLVRQGALSVAVNEGPYNSPAGLNASRVGIAMSFTLNTQANFRLGLAVDSVGSRDYTPDYISISNVFSTAITRDGNADMIFFDIQGMSGDTFNVALWQNKDDQLGGQAAALSLVTFDAIPEPSTGLLALVGMGCLAIHSRRRR